MAKFTREQAREKIMNRKRRMQKLEIELPDLEELNGELALQELSLGDYDDAEKLSLDENKEEDQLLSGCVLVARSVVLYATKERLFEDTDAEWMKQEWGTTVIMPLIEAAKDFSGKSGEAYENAKKNYLIRQKQGSATSSEKSSEVPGQDEK
jgi:hypothetical protein